MSRMNHEKHRRPGQFYEQAEESVGKRARQKERFAPAKAASAGRTLSPEERDRIAAEMGLNGRGEIR